MAATFQNTGKYTVISLKIIIYDSNSLNPWLQRVLEHNNLALISKCYNLEDDKLGFKEV